MVDDSEWINGYREIRDTKDSLKFQKDIDRLECWARKWGMSSQPVKCKYCRSNSSSVITNNDHSESHAHF